MASTHVQGATSWDAGLLRRHVGVGAQAGRRDRGEVMPALVEGDYTAKPRRLLHGETCLRWLRTGSRMAIPGPRDALDMSWAGTDRDQPAWPDEFL